MKLSKEELKKKIDEKVTDEDSKIELLEDIEDSFEVTETEDETEKVSKEDYEEVKTKYEELKTKYKERFLSGDSKETEEKETEDDEGLKKDEVIDVKEIFDEEEK